jgi:thiol-activated cytolysin
VEENVMSLANSRWSRIVLVLAISGLAHAGRKGGGNDVPSEDINKYILKLNYNPQTLLKIVDPNTAKGVPGGRTVDENKIVTVCRSQMVTLSRELGGLKVLSPTTGNIFPGALVKANQHLIEGKPDLITLKRSPLQFSVDLPGLGDESHSVVETPNTATVNAAIDKMKDLWFEKGRTQRANQSLNIKRAFSSQQVSLSLGFSAEWTGGDARMETEIQSNSRVTTFVALFQQIYFTATYEPPSSPAEVFDPAVTLAQVQKLAKITATDPPAYISSVDYGRIVLVKMESKSSEDSLEISAAMNYALSPTKIKAELKAKYEKIISESEFTAMALGGNAKAATRIMGNDPEKAIKELAPLIKESATFTKDEPPAPIAYTVKFLKDSSQALMGFTTKYVDWECKDYPQGWVKMANGGSYKSQFHIYWQELNDKGKWVEKKYESGTIWGGGDREMYMPGDSKGIRVCWDTDPGHFREIHFKEPPNRTFTIYGLWPKNPSIEY